MAKHTNSDKARQSASDNASGGNGSESRAQRSRRGRVVAETTTAKHGFMPWLKANRRAVILCSVVVILGLGGVLAVKLYSLLSDPTALFTHTPANTKAADSNTALVGGEGLETPTNPDDTDSAIATASADQTTEVPPDYKFDANTVNIIILGTDADQLRIQQGMNARTDCIMLFSLNLDTKKASIISIPRDSYTKIYSDKGSQGFYGRINAAFSYGGGIKKHGLEYSLSTVSHYLGGIPIDYYVVFDMDLVKDVVNALPHGLLYNMDLDLMVDNYQFKPGWINLNGDLVLRYARLRHTVGGDFGRVDRQQKIMVALFDQLKKQSQLSMVPKLYDAVRQNVTTNLSDIQIAALAWFGRSLDMNNITRYTIPGTSMNIKGSSIVISDQYEKARIVKEVFNVDISIKKEETSAYLKKKIEEAYNSGKSVLTQAQELLSNSKSYFAASEATALNNAIRNWKAASAKNDTQLMDDLQQDVETEYNVLFGAIKERKAAIENGKKYINWAKKNLNDYRNFISGDDANIVNSLVAQVQGLVDTLDYNNVSAATEDLKNKANLIFKAADDAMKAQTPPPEESTPPPEESTNPPETSNPPETATDAPTPTPASESATTDVAPT